MDETYMEDGHEVGIKHCDGLDVYLDYLMFRKFDAIGNFNWRKFV